MKFQELVSPSLKDLFVKQMEDLILSGKLAIGDKLPNERDMALQMKVSRSIVNSGMQELSSKAFIKIIPRKGAFVEDYIHNGNINTLNAILKNHGISFDYHLFTSFVEFRRDLETICAHKAALNRSDIHLFDLGTFLEEIRVSKTIDELLDATVSFHHQIFVSTNNIVYPLVFNAFYDVLTTITRDLLRIISKDIVYTNALKIFNAIKNQEAYLAQELMKAYIDECALKLEQTKHR